MLGHAIVSPVPTNFENVIDVQLLQRDSEPLAVDSTGRLVDGQCGMVNILDVRYKNKSVERKGKERSQRNDARDLHDWGSQLTDLRFVRGRPESKDERFADTSDADVEFVTSILSNQGILRECRRVCLDLGLV
jgi:hypothetical protein